MGDLSFVFENHHDYLTKLEAEYADLKLNPLSTRHAMNFAMNAYHMCEWVWEYESRVTAAYGKSKDFYDTVNLACPSMQVMRDITNGSKHTKITRGPTPVVKSTELHHGVFNPSVFSSAFNISALLIVMADGTTRIFLDEATASMDFWRCAFQTGFQI